MAKLHIYRPQPPWRTHPAKRAWCGAWRAAMSVVDAGEIPTLTPNTPRFGRPPDGICQNCWAGAVNHARRTKRPLLAQALDSCHDEASYQRLERELSTFLALARAHWDEWAEALELEDALDALAGRPAVQRRLL